MCCVVLRAYLDFEHPEKQPMLQNNRQLDRNQSLLNIKAATPSHSKGLMGKWRWMKPAVSVLMAVTLLSIGMCFLDIKADFTTILRNGYQIEAEGFKASRCVLPGICSRSPTTTPCTCIFFNPGQVSLFSASAFPENPSWSRGNMFHRHIVPARDVLRYDENI